MLNMRLKTRSGHEITKTPQGTVEVRTPADSQGRTIIITDISEHDAASVGARTSRVPNPDDATDAYANGLVAFAMRRMRRDSGNN